MDSSSSATSSRKPSANIDRFGPAALHSQHELTAGEACTILTAAGTGCFHYAGLAVTRRRRDDVCDLDGLFFYLRDLDSGQYWSATVQPAGRELQEYDVQWLPTLVRFRSLAQGIEAQLEICLT